MIHHVTSARNSHQRLGRIVTSHSQQLKPRQLVPRLIELLKKSRPMLLQSLESTPQCCYMGVSIHRGTPLAGWCMMKKHFEIGDLGVHPFMGSPWKPPYACYACYALLCYVLQKAQCHHTESESSVLLPCLNEHTSKFIKALEQTLKRYGKSGTCLKAFVTMEYHGSRTNPGYTVLFEQGTP